MAFLSLYTNRAAERDFLKNAFLANAHRPQDIYIASAFFTDDKTICDLANSGHRIRLIVRLGFPTNPTALKAALDCENVEVRFFTSGSFHPKLYLFEDTALVGSANFTQSGLMTNQEITVSIPREDERYDDLQILFGEYWSEAAVFTESSLEQYAILFNKYDFSADEMLKRKVKSEIGDYTANNISRGKTKKDSKTLFLENYRKIYQECTSAFKNVAQVYEDIERRKFTDDIIPFNLEVDAFLDFIRREHAPKDTWMNAPLLSGDEQKQYIQKYVLEWLDTTSGYFETTVVSEKYPAIRKSLQSPESIDSSSFEEIITGLCTVHSFETRLMHFKGGLSTLIEILKNENGEEKIRNSLKYLLHGEGDIVERMYALNFDPEYKLKQFGKANIQEIMGWINTDTPIVNGRTTKVLRFLGFDIRQVSDPWR